MRATDIVRKDKERPVGLMRLQQGAEMCRRLQQRTEMRRQYIAHIPRWRKPVIGYVLTFPTVALATVFVMLMKYYLPGFYFPGATMLTAIVLVALLWGIGPALLSVILSTLSLDYFYISPEYQIGIQGWNSLNWNGLIQILPFFLIGILIAIISGQREAARHLRRQGA